MVSEPRVTNGFHVRMLIDVDATPDGDTFRQILGTAGDPQSYNRLGIGADVLAELIADGR